MLDELATQIAHSTAKVVEIVGIGIIAAGAFATLVIFAYRMTTANDREQAVADFRATLGRVILLGLEFLVAADIINTVAVEPTLENVAVLAAIVAVRTFLSFSLEVEIEGRWPWQRRDEKRKT